MTDDCGFAVSLSGVCCGKGQLCSKTQERLSEEDVLIDGRARPKGFRVAPRFFRT